MKSILPSLLLASLVAGCDEPKPAPAPAPAPSGGDAKAQEHGTTFGNTISAPVDYLDTLNKGKKTAENTIDTTSVNKAIEMFQALEGRNPKDLQELVTSGNIKEIPKDRYGRQLVYDAKTGTVHIDPKPPQPAAK